MTSTELGHPHPVEPEPPSSSGGDVATVAGLWSPEKRQMTLGAVLTITLVAFEAMAIATIMPDVKDDLGGLALYGWVFSGFFLASLVGIVVAGHVADRRGIALPFGVGLLLFGAGLAVGGAASSMGVLVAGRVLQGLGAGTIPPSVYAAIGRSYEPELRPRMFATLSTAWVVPGLVGPSAATLIEHTSSWRWVFLGLLPIVAVAAFIALPPLMALGPPERHDGEEPSSSGRVVWLSLALAGGLAAVFGAGGSGVVALAVPLVLVGVPLAAWSFIRLVPKGTLRLAPGVPAAVGVRGILTWGFFAADAYIPLAVVDGRGGATWVAGVALTAGTLTWTAASWVQARVIDRMGPRRLAVIGFVLIAAGELLMIGVIRGLPLWVSVVAWMVGCAGIGTVYAPLAVTVLGAARPGEEGSASSALQLSDALGIALGTAVSGWIVATSDAGGHSVASSTTVVFLAALAVSVGGVFASTRLPSRVPTVDELPP